jgi:hypothetical protein
VTARSGGLCALSPPRAFVLLGAGANLALQNNAGRSALRIAEELAAPPAAAALRKQRKLIVDMLKGHGAT